MPGYGTARSTPLLAALCGLLRAHRPAFRREPPFLRMQALVLGHLFSRRTVTQALVALGLTDHDWSAFYRLFNEPRVDYPVHRALEGDGHRPLTLYTLLILLRNTVEGLKSVPSHVSEAAEAMGYTRTRQLFKIELPLAVPVIVAGLRMATVNTIAYVAITALIGQGGLGSLFMGGFLRQFPTPVIVGLVLSATLAVAADLGLIGVQRALTPWQRDRR